MPLSVRTLEALMLTIYLSSSAFPGIRRALQSYSPGPLALVRCAVASLVLAVVLAPRGLPRVRREDALRLFVAGSVGIAGYTLSLNMGQETVTAGAASLVVNTAPMWTA